MNWFSQQTGRDVAERFFQILAGTLSLDVSAYIAALRDDRDIEEVFHMFVFALADQQSQLRDQIAHWEAAARAQEAQAEMLARQNAQLPVEPARELLGEGQQELREASNLVKKATRELVHYQKALTAERVTHQKKVEELQQVIISQNTIIARQQMRLNQLAGNTLSGEPSSGETPRYHS